VRWSLLPVTPSNRGRRSFTLVELLVTLTILSLVLLAVGGVFTRTLQSKRRADKRQRKAAMVDALYRRFAEDLRGAFFLDPRLPCFQGSGEQLNFVSTVDGLVPFGQKGASSGGVGYRLIQNEQFGDLYRLYRREQFEGDLMKGGRFQEMYPWVKNLRFSYLRKKKSRVSSEESKYDLIERWDNLAQHGLPLAVEVQIELAFPPPGMAPTELATLESIEVAPFSAVIPLPCGGETSVEK